MRKRVLLIGLLSGLLVSATMAWPSLAFLGHEVIPEAWDTQSAGMVRWLAVSGGLLLLTGALAGAMSGSGSRQGALVAGALAGWLAAWVAEALVVAVAMGAYGAFPVLTHGMRPAESDAQYIALLAESVQGVMVFVHASIALSALVGILLGGLGGLLAGAHGRRAEPQPHFWLAVTLVNVLMAGVNLVVFIAVYLPLQQTLQSAAEEQSITLPFPPSLLFDLPVGINWLWLLFWQIVAWRLLPKVGAARRMNGLKAALFSAIGAIFLAVGLVGFFRTKSLLWLFVWLLAFLLGVLFARLTANHFPGRLKTFLQRQGEARLAGWAILAFSVLIWLMLGVRRSEHAWLTPGLLAGVILSVAGVRSVRHAVPPMEEPSLRSGAIGWAAFLAWLPASLFGVLCSIAPLALVLLVITMIPSLLPGASPEPTENSVGMMMVMYQSMIHVFGISLTFLFPLATSLLAALFYALFRWLGPGRQEEQMLEG
ncbi:MAG: hypothetical protein D6770_07485 [Anaerolineae bacterium]|nr:MAG: hypothetical protein D6770_07485 [Anaerolineae bacterium]